MEIVIAGSGYPMLARLCNGMHGHERATVCGFVDDNLSNKNRECLDADIWEDLSGYLGKRMYLSRVGLQEDVKYARTQYEDYRN